MNEATPLLREPKLWLLESLGGMCEGCAGEVDAEVDAEPLASESSSAAVLRSPEVLGGMAGCTGAIPSEDRWWCDRDRAEDSM